ncbi:MAG: deoxyguanosinetriphosphate triphosphohydrolase, partial [Hyphomicrobiaceae bacterium]|nr:deoxyguanosinetriphosphate triphosphohydrolase [Hyphomicrobiaceae bacterium]
TLRILTGLEQRYPAFDGLNLCFETLEGLIKHNGPLLEQNGAMIRKNTSDEMLQTVRGFEQTYGFRLHHYASLEGQVAAISDDIAYNNHDIDDGLRAGLIRIDDLQDVPFVWDVIGQIKDQHKDIVDERLVFELNRRLITLMIGDVREETTRRLAELSPQNSDDIRKAGRTIACFSERFSAHFKDLQDFLRERVYQNEHVREIMADAEAVTDDIVRYFLKKPQALPKEWLCTSAVSKKAECAVSIKDYVAGMTDRYILSLHRSLFDVTPKLR